MQQHNAKQNPLPSGMGNIKLICSRGHVFDTTNMSHRITWGDNRLIVNGRCPMLMSYDRIDGSTYCKRVLKEFKDNPSQLEPTEQG